MKTGDSESIRSFLQNLPAAKHWEPASMLLQALLRENLRTITRTTYHKDQTITAIGDRRYLSVIVAGNAHLVIPRQDLSQGKYEHPLILQEGDFIGEFEAFGNSPFMTSVVAGLPFRPPNKSRTKPQTEVLEIPIDRVLKSSACWEGMFKGISRKISRLNHLLPIVAAGGQKQLSDVIPHFFCGNLPVFRYWVRTSDGIMREKSAVRSDQGKTGDMGYITLGTVSEKEPVRGVETSTTYLGHLGFSNLQKVLNDFKVQPTYWKRLGDRKSSKANEHHLFGQKTDGAGIEPQSAECILFFLKKEITLDNYLSSRRLGQIE